MPLLFVALTVFTTCTSWAVDQPWVLDRSNHVELAVRGPTIAIRTTGVDPYVVWRFSDSIEADDRVLEFEYFCTEEIDAVSCFLGPPISEATRFDLPDLMIAEGWQTYTADLVGASGRPIPRSTSMIRIDFGAKPNVHLQIRDVQLRKRTSREVTEKTAVAARRQHKVEQSEAVSRYLNFTFPVRLDDVTVDERFVTLMGMIPDPTTNHASWRLIEYPAHESISSDGIECTDTIEVTGSQFQIRVPRTIEGRDRLHSGWRIRQTESNESRYLTARHYPTTLVPSSSDYAAERARPKSQKGLSGMSHRGPPEELPSLGVHAVTLNLVLNRFLSSSAGEGRHRIDVPGQEVYFDSRVFAGYDALIDFSRQHEIVVTAIVLIPRSKRAGLNSPLVHPETDGGVYAMPDLSTDRGARIYALVLDKIAQRYRNTAEMPGGITNWIAHNEIDFHPIWTNMGRQPREVVTETYYRSMRMIHNAARAHNPHARVFASLTHHWAVPDDGSWKQLAPREVLRTLQRYSALEGDFGWGVAFHPYPQSLFAPVAWKDTDVRDDFETPLVTIQNLEVLGRFLASDEMRDRNGNMRPVLLSEQGFHTESYDPEAQDRQAGSLWYAMKKVRANRWIESFHYHRWIDHPDEGGLMLGLRTLPTKEHKHGERKRAWYLYQSIDTESEAEASEGLPKP